MMQVEGYVQAIEPYPTKTGKTMYNVRVNGVKYGAGMYPPKFKAGDFISFQSTMNGNFNNMETRTVTVKVPPAGAAPMPNLTQTSGTGTGNKVSYDDRQMMICHQAARKDALNMVEMLVGIGAVVGLDKAKTPADKMTLIETLITEYTEKFYFETTSEELDIPTSTAGENSDALSKPSSQSWE